MQTDPTSFEFTRARIEAATCPAGKSQALFWDTKQPGLGLRVTPGGKRSFIFEGRLGRQTIRMTIGPASMPIRVPKDRKGNPRKQPEPHDPRRQQQSRLIPYRPGARQSTNRQIPNSTPARQTIPPEQTNAKNETSQKRSPP